MDRFSSEVERVLRKVGWRPGRRTDVEFWLDHFEARGCSAPDAAVGFLVEFGGLDFQLAGRGIDRAREPFDLDPVLCSGNLDRFTDWGQVMERSIFPIGVLGSRYYCLGIDEFSEIYILETWIASFGQMPQALEGLISGCRPKRIDTGSGDHVL